jgi:ABC-2 type transport system ATP-binding protein
LANGRLVREGRLDELIAIENQTDLVLRNATPALLNEIQTLAGKSNAEVVQTRKSTTTLERLFLDATQKNDELE